MFPLSHGNYFSMKRTRLKIFYPLVVLSAMMILPSCEPTELPSPQTEDPKYLINCLMDGGELSLKAGVEDYYNSSWFEEGPEQSIRFTSIMSKDSCIQRTCPGTFAIDLYGKIPRSSDPVTPDSHLGVGFRPWENANEQSISWWFKAVLDGLQGPVQPGNTDWFLNGKPLERGLSELNYMLKDTASTFELCANMQYANASRRQIICQRVVNLRKKPLTAQLIGDANQSQSQVKLQAKVQNGTPPYKFFWNQERGLENHILRMSFDTSRVDFMVEDSEGNRITIQNVVDLGKPNGFLFNANLNLEIERRIQVKPVLGKAAISWTDEQGQLFQSKLARQDSLNFFRIKELKLVPEGSGPGKWVSVSMEFDAILKSSLGEVIYVEEGTARMLYKFSN